MDHLEAKEPGVSLRSWWRAKTQRQQKKQRASTEVKHSAGGQKCDSKLHNSVAYLSASCVNKHLFAQKLVMSTSQNYNMSIHAGFPDVQSSCETKHTMNNIKDEFDRLHFCGNMVSLTNVCSNVWKSDMMTALLCVDHT